MVQLQRQRPEPAAGQGLLHAGTEEDLHGFSLSLRLRLSTASSHSLTPIPQSKGLDISVRLRLRRPHLPQPGAGPGPPSVGCRELGLVVLPGARGQAQGTGFLSFGGADCLPTAHAEGVLPPGGSRQPLPRSRAGDGGHCPASHGVCCPVDDIDGHKGRREHSAGIDVDGVRIDGLEPGTEPPLAPGAGDPLLLHRPRLHLH